MFHFELFHRVYNKALSPAAGSKFTETASIKLLFHIDDKTGPNQKLDEYILYDGSLTTYDGSSASFISHLEYNERLRFIHAGSREIATEILMKVTAIR